MNIPPEAAVIGRRRGKATQRHQFHQRVAGVLRLEIAPLADRVPVEELTAVAAAIWRKAYHLGYQAGHLDWRKGRA